MSHSMQRRLNSCSARPSHVWNEKGWTRRGSLRTEQMFLLTSAAKHLILSARVGAVCAKGVRVGAWGVATKSARSLLPEAQVRWLPELCDSIDYLEVREACENHCNRMTRQRRRSQRRSRQCLLLNRCGGKCSSLARRKLEEYF